MEHGADIAFGPDSVHEDVRQARLGEERAVAAGRLALARAEVQEPVAELLEVRAQGGVHVGEDARGPHFQFGDVAEGPERGAVLGVGGQVPGPQSLDAQRSPTRLQQPLRQRDDLGLDGISEGQAVFGRIVEALQGPPHIERVRHFALATSYVE